jgi:hypothetical protein
MSGYAPFSDTYKLLPDQRLRQRLARMVDTFTQQLNCSIPQATANRNDMDAAYQFFKNSRVGSTAIVASGLPETLQQLAVCDRILSIQDTTDLNYSSLDDTTGLGYTDGPGGRGLKLHSTLAVRPDGLPVGLLTQQFWARDPQHKGKVNKRRRRAAKDKESYRWQDHAQLARQVLPPDATVVHIADREGDIYDWLAAERPANAQLLIRVAQAHRVVVHGTDGARGHLAAVIRAAPVLGRYELAVPRAGDKPARDAVLTVRLAAMQAQPPRHAKQRSQLPAIPVWVVEALEESPPPGSKAICWRLVTTERVETWEQALRALREYVLRWLIERFHFILKSGCRVEQLQLTSAERLVNAVAVYSQVAVRVQRLTYLARVDPQAPAEREFSKEEIAALESYQQKTAPKGDSPVHTVGAAVRLVARMGGHLGRRGDGPPGVKVLWRGLRRLHDILLGCQLAPLIPERYP